MSNTPPITREALESARANLLALPRDDRYIPIDHREAIQETALALYRRAEAELTDDNPAAIVTPMDLAEALSAVIYGYDWSEPNPLAIVNVDWDVPDYNPDKSHDGGSYYQPSVAVQFSDGVTVRIDDASCGDFGSRIWAEIITQDGTIAASAHWGTMEPDNEWTGIDEYVWYSHLVLAEAATGYDILTVQQQAAYADEEG